MHKFKDCKKLLVIIENYVRSQPNTIIKSKSVITQSRQTYSRQGVY